MSNLFSGSYAIQDNEVISYIQTIDYSSALWNETITKEFCNLYRNWILSTTLNNVQGLDNFTHSMYSNGTTQTFELFYIKNKNKRFRCFKGEYVYHQIAWRNNWKDWAYIEDCPLESNDAVIISLPFSDTGNKHVDMDKVISECNKLNIPVLIDCAYFAICKNIDFNFSHNCITDIVFSLSKSFPVANARIGMRFTKIDDDDLMFVYDKINYTNRLGATLGHFLLEKYSPDFIHNKYKNKQQICCDVLKVEPSNSVIFGIDNKHRFNEYNRGSVTNRIGFHKLYTLDEKSMKDILYANTDQ
jgi:hypothetical protein